MPLHIGIILDGNRRWASAQDLPSAEGHLRGYDKMKQAGEWCIARGVKILTVYAFSTENWKRSKAEVSMLMQLFYRAFREEAQEFVRRGIRVKILGRREGLPTTVQKAIAHVEEVTRACTAGTLQVALNYGGREEIVDACKAALASGIDPAAVTSYDLGRFLYAPESPDPDMIIRPGGEQRLSGFLTWESIYSELYFTSVLWPDFTEADLDVALAWYASRSRRFGK